ncbi:MAG: response regulator [Pseudolabrys sp.]
MAGSGAASNAINSVFAMSELNAGPICLREKPCSIETMGDALSKPLTGMRCLVVDDEFLIALDIQQALELAGAAEVVCAGNATEALAAVKARRFDVAVLDVRLGRSGGSSLPVAEVLADARTPFVFLTGLRGDSAEARTYPHVPVVEKPYDAKALLAAIGQAAGGQA